MFLIRQSNRRRPMAAALGSAVGAALVCLLFAPASVQAKGRAPLAEDCDPIVIDQGKPKKAVAKQVRKVAHKVPAKKAPEEQAAVVGEGEAKPQITKVKATPRPKPKPKMTTVAMKKPLVISDACPGAGSNDDSKLPTSLKDIAGQQSVEETLADVFPDPAAGGMSAANPVVQRLTTLAPASTRSRPGTSGGAVPLSYGGGGGGGIGGTGSTPPTETPDDGEPDPNLRPPTDNPNPNDTDPKGPDPKGPDPKDPDPKDPDPKDPPVKVPEPGTLGVLLMGLGGLAVMRRRRNRA